MIHTITTATQHLDRIMEGLIIGPESQDAIVREALADAELVRYDLEDLVEEIIDVLETARTADDPTPYIQAARRLYAELDAVTPARPR